MPWRSVSTESVGVELPQRRARRDLIVIGVLVAGICIMILNDPDRAFEWLADHREAQLDEFVAALAVMGAGFALFSWRRWVDLSRQVAEYKRLQTELSRLHRDSALMSETDDLLQSCVTTEEAYNVVGRHFEIQFPNLSGAIYSIEREQGVAGFVAGWGAAPEPTESFGISTCWGLRRGRMNISMATDAKLACIHFGKTLPEFSMCVPMMAQGETIGVLCLYTSQEKKNWQPLTDAQQQTVKTLAEHLSLAAANLTLRETLRVQSIRDPLTGLFNRRYMEEVLAREVHRSARKSLPLAVLMVDLDHFKRLNDSYGHEAGDAVLRELAAVFQQQLRGEDTASRYGGEEFTVILPETSREAAWECAERIREAVQAMQITHYGQVISGITLSAGIALYPEQGGTSETLMRAADLALYRAKQNGRNQVLIAERS